MFSQKEEKVVNIFLFRDCLKIFAKCAEIVAGISALEWLKHQQPP